MTAENQHIEIHAGDSKTVLFNVTKPDGSAINMAGGLPIMTVARTMDAPDADKVFLVQGVWETYTANAQTYYRAKFELVPTHTAALQPDTFVHMCRAYFSNVKVQTFASGRFTILASLPTA